MLNTLWSRLRLRGRNCNRHVNSQLFRITMIASTASCGVGFFLPKLVREHVGRYLEFINPRMYIAYSSSGAGEQAAAGLNMLLPSTAQIKNLHDDRFPNLLRMFSQRMAEEVPKYARGKLGAEALEGLRQAWVPRVEHAAHQHGHEHNLCDFVKVCMPKGRMCRGVPTASDLYMEWMVAVYPNCVPPARVPS